jgi:hypothetical protein
VLVALATRTTLWLFIAYGVLAVAASVGFAWLTVVIARDAVSTLDCPRESAGVQDGRFADGPRVCRRF